MSISSDRPLRPSEGQRVAVVGPCGAGKSCLVAALRERGVSAREVAQEHSYAPAMWQRLARPDLLVYLDVSREVAGERLGRELPLWLWEAMAARLAHARAHADLVVQTDRLLPGDVLDSVLEFLQQAMDHGPRATDGIL